MIDYTTNEEWRPVVGFEEFYAVSNHGRVMRTKNANNVKAGRIRNPAKAHGYLFVGMYAKPIYKQEKVHRLVAEAFLGKCPEGHQVNHIDGNKENNHLSNLEYCTPKENIQHAHRMGLVTHTDGEINGMAKLNQSQVDAIRRLYAAGGITQKQLGNMFGVRQGAIHKIVRGKRWKHS